MGHYNEVPLMEGPFHMENGPQMLLLHGTEGAVNKVQYVARVLNDLSAEEKESIKADIRNHFSEKQCKRKFVAGNVESEQGGIINPGQAKPIKCYNCNGLGHKHKRERIVTNLNDNVDEFTQERLALNVGSSSLKLINDDAFDSDCDELQMYRPYSCEISRVYTTVEGLGHNLFSVGQFCDSDLEVAFRKHSCFVRDINGADLLKGSRSTNLYTISIDDMMKVLHPSNIALLSTSFQVTIIGCGSSD
ncbi:hypothetical protein Tco_1500361 [Tanacetum coccineum]